MVGEHGKPELVTPLSPSGDVANKKITISNRLKQQFAAGDNTRMMGADGGGKSGKQEISVKGAEVTDSTPLMVYLDGRVVNKSVLSLFQYFLL